MFWVGVFCLPNHWFDPLLHWALYLFLQCILDFRFDVIHFLLVIFIISISFIILLSILTIITLNSYLINCLSPFHLSHLVENPLVPSFGACFFVSAFYLPLCVCFYVLSRSVMTPCFGRVALCSQWLMGPSGVDSLIAWAGYSKNVPCACYVGPPVIIQSWLLLIHLCVGSMHRLAGSEAQPTIQQENYYAGAEVEFASGWFCACWNFPMDILLMKLIGFCSVFV